MRTIRDTTQNRRPDRQGSALLTAIILSTILLLGIAGLMPMLLSDWKHTVRTGLQESAFALAESALDEAIWAVKEYAEDVSTFFDIVILPKF